MYQALIDVTQDNLYNALVAAGLDPKFETQNIIDGSDPLINCLDCKGKGGWYYHEWESCQTCDGTGKVKNNER